MARSDSESRSWIPRARFLLANLGAWVLFAVVVSTWLHAERRGLGVPADWWRIFRASALIWGLWSIPTAVIFWLFRRFPWHPGRWRRALGIHVAASLLWMPVYAALLLPMGALAFDIPWRLLPRHAPSFFGTMFWVEYLLYWPPFAVAAAHDGLRRARDREVLARALTEARLEALRAQIQPHFLFNTLAAISGLLRAGETALSARCIELLADLLRRVVSLSAGPLVSLADELETSMLYLEIQQARCGDRLSVEIDADPLARDFAVPNLLLQPLLENAFEHGVARVAGPVLVTLGAHCTEGGRLMISVTNPIPRTEPKQTIEGLGVANTRSRVELLFPGDATLDLRIDAESARATVRVDLPARPMR